MPRIEDVAVRESVRDLLKVVVSAQEHARYIDDEGELPSLEAREMLKIRKELSMASTRLLSLLS